MMHRSKQHLIDQLIGDTQQVCGDGETERLGCPEVDDKFKFRWLLDRQSCRACTFQDFVDVGGGASSLTIDTI